MLTVAMLTGLGYGFGIYYSLVNDPFHDFFTEHIPFGEDAVLYFEERQFKRRFPHAAHRITNTPRQASNKVTVPSGSGVSWRVVKEEDKSQSDHEHKEKHESPSRESQKPTGPEEAHPQPDKAIGAETLAAAKDAKEEPTSPTSPPSIPHERSKGGEEQAATPPVIVIEDPRLPPIELLAVSEAEEPVVQDVVKIINTLITTVNADRVSPHFSSAIDSARSELSQLGNKITAARDKAVDDNVRAAHEEFDQAAERLVRHLEDKMREQEARWQDEFESEREKLSKSYHDKLETELERVRQIHEQRSRNEMLEQAVAMKRQFLGEVQDRVEEERNGRLSKLSELSSSVQDLEQLATGWNDVIDSTLQTQRLHVAVEAVRAQLESAGSPRPFVRELAALKEIASDDPVVNAAIASLNPAGYQRGLPTSAQLIDRFRRVAAEVRKASLVPDQAGATSHAASVLLSKLLFRKQGRATGDDVESILARAETFLEEGNLDEAAREMNGLTGWAKTLSRDWLAEVRTVLEVHQALDVSVLPPPFFFLPVRLGIFSTRRP